MTAERRESPAPRLRRSDSRNTLAHGYAEIDHNNVYDIAVKHAPELLALLEKP